MRKRTLATLGCGLLGAALMASPTVGHAASVLGYTIHQVDGYGGEPSITAGPVAPTIGTPGELYEASLFGARAFRSTNQGINWTNGANGAFSSTGDDCVVTDQSGALYLCNLTITGPSNAPLQGDVYKSVDQGDHWTHSSGVPFGVNPNCATSCSAFGVDRDWIDAYIPASQGSDTTKALVALMYHDFYGPSHIWVNISHDGGATFGTAIDVLAHLNTSAGAGGALSLLNTACSTVPSNVQIVKSGPHAGRIYVAWIAADPSSFATGCNITQAQAFHNLYVAWSDDQGATWTPQLAFDGGPGHDASTPFVAFTLDNAGNPYFSFAMNHWDPNAVTNASNIGQCSILSQMAGNQLQSHPECEYDFYVVWSADGGITWDDGSTSATPPAVPGAAITPYRVNPPTQGGNHQFPAIAVGGVGQVDVAYLSTSTIEPTAASGKYLPGGCAGPATANNPNFPPACKWDLYAAQANLNGSTPATANLWTIDNISSGATPETTPMHVGDICNLGIFCTPTISNRHLADFIMQAMDPVTGCAHISYADDHNATNAINSADQTGASCFNILQSNAPEVPAPILLLPIAGAAIIGTRWMRKRRGPAWSAG
ncbi:MAG: exo-alpha-sialidase [Candidatus Dormibacteraeota bacterium]|nr:exo-alpha-sialidase [Candidatus Dormibacteraeota bacterium]